MVHGEECWATGWGKLNHIDRGLARVNIGL